MKKIGFIGAYDKTDLIIYISKLLVENGLKVLIIDSTTLQKTRYTVPCITPSKYYITTYEDIDIAIGFETLQEIRNYTQMPELNYDMILLDVDNREAFENLEMHTSDKNYFVTSPDLFSLKKGLEVLSGIRQPLELTKIFFSNKMSEAEDEYLNFLSLGYRINWNPEKIYFPMLTSDQDIIMENQRISKIKFKGLSSEYKDSLIYLIQEICEENMSNVKKIIKQLERGV